MMQAFAADLHTHSCLSPCGDMLMTPNNLVNMAYLKGIDVLAVSDHNSALNLPAISVIAEARGILLIPAIEAESKEEVHVVCYFPTVEVALRYSQMLNDGLPNLPVDVSFFGEQVIMNDDDEPIGKESKLLTQATALSVDEIADCCRAVGGVPVPAHINREANSIITALGFISPELNFHTVEVSPLAPPPLGVDLNMYRRVLTSSDAHCLESILERKHFIHLEEKTVAAFLDYIK